MTRERSETPSTATLSRSDDGYIWTAKELVDMLCVCIEQAVAADPTGVRKLKDNVKSQWHRIYPRDTFPETLGREASEVMERRKLLPQNEKGAGRPRKDIAGDFSGPLTAIRPTGFKSKAGRVNWLCECVCTETFLDNGYTITRPKRILLDVVDFSRQRTSCGNTCTARAAYSYHLKKHVIKKYYKEIAQWESMHRVEGAEVAHAWCRNFKQFLKDMGAIPDGSKQNPYKTLTGEVIEPQYVFNVVVARHYRELPFSAGNVYWRLNIKRKPKRTKEQMLMDKSSCDNRPQWRKDIGVAIDAIS